MADCTPSGQHLGDLGEKVGHEGDDEDHVGAHEDPSHHGDGIVFPVPDGDEHKVQAHRVAQKLLADLFKVGRVSLIFDEQQEA